MAIRFGGETVTPRQFAKLQMDDAAQGAADAQTSEFAYMTKDEMRKVEEALQRQADRIHRFLFKRAWEAPAPVSAPTKEDDDGDDTR